MAQMGRSGPVSPLHQMAIANSLTSGTAAEDMIKVVLPAYREQQPASEKPNAFSASEMVAQHHHTTRSPSTDKQGRSAPLFRMQRALGKLLGSSVLDQIA